MINILWSENCIVRGLTAAEDFGVQIESLTIPTQGSETLQTVKDISYKKSIAASTSLGALVTVVPNNLPATITTDTPTVCTIAGNIVTPLATGDAGIVVTTSLGVRRYLKRVEINSNVPQKTTTEYTSGSLARHIFDSVSAMTFGKTAGPGTKELFSTANYDLNNPSATRNANLFSGGLDLSAISFAHDLDRNTWQYYNFPCMLISNQIIIFAWHVRPGNGTKITFMRPDGSFQKVTVSGDPLQIKSLYEDIGLAKLSAPITGITPLATLGAGYEKKIPCMSSSPEQPAPTIGLQMPVLFKGGRLGNYDFANRLDILPLNKLYQTLYSNVPPFRGEFLSTFQPWADDIVGGDSSGPTLLPINGEAILIGCQFGPGTGPSIPDALPLINTAMSTLMGSTTNMRVADLSAFTTFN